MLSVRVEGGQKGKGGGRGWRGKGSRKKKPCRDQGTPWEQLCPLL